MELWKELTYKEYHGPAYNDKIPTTYKTGFFSQSVAGLIFPKIWEEYKQYMLDLKVPEEFVEDPLVDSEYWKISFTINEPICGSLEKDSEDDDEDFLPENLPLLKAEITCTVKVVETAEESPDLPLKTYVNFKYKGNK